VTETGGATALAALTSGAYVPQDGERVGVVLCGGNTDPDHNVTTAGYPSQWCAHAMGPLPTLLMGRPQEPAWSRTRPVWLIIADTRARVRCSTQRSRARAGSGRPPTLTWVGVSLVGWLRE
jgi:hypothetical protein